MLSQYSFHTSNQQGVVASYNAVLKYFPDGTKHFKYSSYSNVKGQNRNITHNGSSSAEELQRYNFNNLIRRRQNISDLAYCNGCERPWQYFVTLTFDDNFVGDSYSHEKVSKFISNWLHYQRKKNPKMRYLLVPELHKSGRIHFHGIFSDVPNWILIPAVNSKTGKIITKNGKTIYNLKNYKLGFTTISKIENLEAVSHYITKYITKELLNLKHKRNVWHSKNLLKPKQTFHLITKEDAILFLDNNDISFQKNTDKENYNKIYACVNSIKKYK